MTSRTTLLILFFLASAPIAWAEMTINGPSNVSEYTPFTLNATLPATDQFTSIQVMVSGKTLATIYPTGQCILQPDGLGVVSHCSTTDQNPSSNEGLTLTLSHAGLAKGTHTFTLTSVGSNSETQSLEIESSSFVNVESIMANQVDLEQRLVTAEATIEGQVGTISQLEQQLQEAQSQNEMLNNEVNELRSRLSTQEGSLTALADKTQQVEQEVGKSIKNPFAGDTSTPPVVETASSNPLTGLASGTNAPLIGVGVLVVAVIAGFFFFRGRKKGEGFGKESAPTPFFEGTMDSLFKGLPGKNANEARPEIQPKKWSSDVESELREDIENNPPERDSKIHFSDLTR